MLIFPIAIPNKLACNHQSFLVISKIDAFFLSAQTLQHALKQLSASDVDIHVLTIPTNSFSCSLLIVLCIFVYCKTNTLIPVILIERQQLLFASCNTSSYFKT